MTDQVELPAETKTPPIVLAAEGFPISGIIRFDSTVYKDLTIPLQIRDEDTLETLTTRFRVVTGASNVARPFDCPDPEPTIAGTGEVIRRTQIVIDRTKLDKGACSRIDFVVSSQFLPCKRFPEWFDVPVGTDGDGSDIGRATFWVWEVSNSPLMDESRAQALLGTCPTIDQATPTTMMAP